MVCHPSLEEFLNLLLSISEAILLKKRGYTNPPIWIVMRGTCSFHSKGWLPRPPARSSVEIAMNAMNSGAGGIVIINTEQSSFAIQDPSVLTPLTIPIVMLPLSLRPLLSGPSSLPPNVSLISAMIGMPTPGKRRMTREVFLRLCDNRELKKEVRQVESSVPQEREGKGEGGPAMASSVTDSHFSLGGSLSSLHLSQRLSLLPLASPSFPSSAPERDMSSLCTEATPPPHLSTSEIYIPLLSFVLSSRNASSSPSPSPLSSVSLHLCRICDQCPLLNQALLHKRFAAIAIFNFCPQSSSTSSSSSLSSCIRSLRSWLPTLLACCGQDLEAAAFPIFLSPISSPVPIDQPKPFHSLEDSLSDWLYVPDEKIGGLWAKVEKLCEDMRPIPGLSPVLPLLTALPLVDLRIKRKLYSATLLSCKFTVSVHPLTFSPPTRCPQTTRRSQMTSRGIWRVVCSKQKLKAQ
jgi:hypothetical protein